MIEDLKQIFQKPDERVKDLSDYSLSGAELEWIKSELKNYPHVNRIKWKQNNIGDENNKQLKVEIEKQLIKNIIKTGHIVVDLSELELGNLSYQ